MEVLNETGPDVRAVPDTSVTLVGFLLSQVSSVRLCLNQRFPQSFQLMNPPKVQGRTHFLWIKARSGPENARRYQDLQSGWGLCGTLIAVATGQTGEYSFAGTINSIRRINPTEDDRILMSGLADGSPTIDAR